MRDSQRTGVALQLSRLAREFVVLTGTPVIDNNIYRLIPWLEQILPVEINTENFWVAAAMMVSREASTGIKTQTEMVTWGFTPLEEATYQKLVPGGLGGTNSTSRMSQIREATELSYKAADRGIIAWVQKLLGEGRGVMLVARSEEHQAKLRDLLVAGGMRAKDIFLITGKESIFLTDEQVEDGAVSPYKVVITTIRLSEGYTLTYLSAMVSGIYPSGEHTRGQLRGRINRLGSSHKLIKYVYVSAGILTWMVENHIQARSLAMALGDLAEKVGVKAG